MEIKDNMIAFKFQAAGKNCWRKNLLIFSIFIAFS